MPILPQHTEEIEQGKFGDHSDLRSMGEPGKGSACTAAAFLLKYVEKPVEWAHIDVAGPAM